jgi:hypothetical protein
MENMASQFDINRFRHSTKSVSQYEKQLDRLIRSGGLLPVQWTPS